MPNVTQIICDLCSKPFYVESKRHKYRIKKSPTSKFFCSTICRSSFSKRTSMEVSCNVCNKKKTIRLSEAKKSKHYFCSSSCAAKFSNTNRASTKNKTKTIVCETCSVTVEVPLHEARSHCFICKPKYNRRFTAGKLVSCKKCTVMFQRRNLAKYCDVCRKEIRSEVGRKSAALQATVRRSKNEISFAKLCRDKFLHVEENKPIFDGWDADVIIHDHKLAVLWNGAWHYKPIKKGTSLLQIQNRDKIKLDKIASAGYEAYIIKDMGKEDTKFVQDQFEILLEKIKTK